MNKSEFVKSKTKRLLVISLVLLGLIYLLSYFLIRWTRTEIWEKDGNAYVIFPADKVYLYYFYRPLSCIDGALTGIKFHIGQH